VAEPVVDIQGLNYSPGGLPVLQDVDLRIARGDYLAVLGPNGGGKSTLLKLMLGLVRPDSGVIRVLGQRPGEAGGRIGYLPSTPWSPTPFPSPCSKPCAWARSSPDSGVCPAVTRKGTTKRPARP